MNSQTSRKIIVASAMAAVVGIGAVTFALRSRPVAPVAQASHPPARVTQIPASIPDATAEIPAAAPVPGASAAGFRIPDDTNERSAGETITNSVDRLKSADELTTMPTTTSLAADDQKMGTSMTELVTSDSQITTDVKTEIARDSLSKDLNIGVSTTHGVVALTGSLASQGAIDHVKDVAGKVKDVKSVDTSALILASL